MLMSEFKSGRMYSAVARRITEAFASSPEQLAEYESRGLIATNNLGLRMLVVDEGPEGSMWEFYKKSLLDARTLEILERTRQHAPDLWRESVDAYKSKTELTSAYFTALQEYGFDDARTRHLGEQSSEMEWRDIELRTKVFGIIEQEPLSEEEAMALCV